MNYPEAKLIPTEDLLNEIYERTALCIIFVIEEEKDIETNTNTFVAKGSPSLLGAISGALVYDAAKLVYDNTGSKEASRLYIDNYNQNYNDSMKLIYEKEIV